MAVLGPSIYIPGASPLAREHAGATNGAQAGMQTTYEEQHVPKFDCFGQGSCPVKDGLQLLPPTTAGLDPSTYTPGVRPPARKQESDEPNIFPTLLAS